MESPNKEIKGGKIKKRGKKKKKFKYKKQLIEVQSVEEILKVCKKKKYERSKSNHIKSSEIRTSASPQLQHFPLKKMSISFPKYTTLNIKKQLSISPIT